MGTPAFWYPNSRKGESIDNCKSKCVQQPNCVAFVWRDSDASCNWKRGVSVNTLYANGGHDCWMSSKKLIPPTCSDFGGVDTQPPGTRCCHPSCGDKCGAWNCDKGTGDCCGGAGKVCGRDPLPCHM